MPERIEFKRELDVLHKDLIKMGAMLEESIDEMIEALETQDLELTKSVIAREDEIDKMELKVEKDCIYLIARQQPIASDLRDVASILKIITDLERIADHCEDICIYIIKLSQQTYVKPIEHLPAMAKEVKAMVKTTIDSCLTKNIEKANIVIEQDDVIDDYFNMIVDELIGIMESDPSTIRQCKEFMFIAKYLERMGDHATNIAEWISFTVTGKHI
jgi:phosphate transport system protein